MARNRPSLAWRGDLWPRSDTNLASAGQHIQSRTEERQERADKKGKTGNWIGNLELFNQEGQKLLKVAKARLDKNIERSLETAKLAEKHNAPFSHISPLMTPPPYETKSESTSLYPQLPLLTTEGRYNLENDDHQILETGRATTTIVMTPETKSKQRPTSSASGSWQHSHWPIGRKWKPESLCGQSSPTVERCHWKRPRSQWIGKIHNQRQDSTRTTRASEK